MTNYEKIKAMTVEEMVRGLSDIRNDPYSCYYCLHKGDINGCKNEVSCEDGIKKYLESEAE